VLPLHVSSPSEAKRSFLRHIEDRLTSARAGAQAQPDEPFGAAISAGIQASLDRLLPARLRPSSDLPEAQAAFAAREAIQTLSEMYEVSAFDTLFAPYWYLRGRLWEAVRGRNVAGSWAVTSSICDLEVSRPAFPASLPLPQTAPNLAQDGAILPGEWLAFWPEGLWITSSLPAEEAATGITDIHLCEKIDAVTRKSFFFVRNAMLVFRPIGLMTLASRDETFEILIDLFSGMPAGTVSTTEMEGLVKAASRTSPLDVASRGMKSTPLSCPKCRIDIPHRFAGEVFLCPNCGEAYEASQDQLKATGWAPGPWVAASSARAFWKSPSGALLPADTGRKRSVELLDGGPGDAARKKQLLSNLKRPVRVARLEAARAFELIESVSSPGGEGTTVDPATLRLVLASEDALMAYSRVG
jgi:hypothetical protein